MYLLRLVGIPVAIVALFIALAAHLNFEWRSFGIVMGAVVIALVSFFIAMAITPEPEGESAQSSFISFGFVFGGLSAIAALCAAAAVAPPKAPAYSHETNKVLNSLRTPAGWEILSDGCTLENKAANLVVDEDGVVRSRMKEHSGSTSKPLRFSKAETKGIEEQAKKTRIALATTSVK